MGITSFSLMLRYTLFIQGMVNQGRYDTVEPAMHHLKHKITKTQVVPVVNLSPQIHHLDFLICLQTFAIRVPSGKPSSFLSHASSSNILPFANT